MSLKMYVLIRDDLSPAQQAVQAGHALAKFGLDYPQEFEEWQTTSNILIYLSVSNIAWWQQVLTDGDYEHSVFHEPDRVDIGPYSYSGADTAIAVAPSWTCQYILFKYLPLALPPKKRKWWQR